MANEQNLNPGDYKLSQEEAKRGGIKSGKVRREKRAAQEDAKFVLNLIVSGESEYDPDEIVDLAGLHGKKITVQTAGMLAQARKAIKGDRQALETLVTLAGEKPSEKKDITLQAPVTFEGMDDIDD